MDPSLCVALLWLLFGGTHIGLATGRVRGELVARLGAGGFFWVFTGVAAASFSLLVHTYATHRFEGPAGLGLAALEPVRWLAMVASVAGVVLATASLAVYPRSPMALFGQRVHPPRGLERVTRHPFFVGVALLALAHVLVAPHRVGAVFFAGLGTLALVGAHHQDAKLRVLLGRPYADYLAQTSTLPFAAVLSGRQHLAWRELPGSALALGLALAALLRSLHGAIFDRGGAWVILAVLAGGGIASFRSWRRARRTIPLENPLASLR